MRGILMKSSDYWRERSLQTENALHADVKVRQEYIDKIYAQTSAQVAKEIESWYQRLASNNDISISYAKALLKNDELKEFKWNVKDYIKYGKKNALDQHWMKELENASAKHHISKLEALEIETRQKIEAMSSKELKSVSEEITKTYTESYMQNSYELQKGIGIGFNLSGINSKKVEALISKPWTADGKNFSDRIWGRKSEMIDTLHKQLSGVALGTITPEQAIRSIQHKFDVSKGKAKTLVQTELSHFTESANYDSMKEMGVDEFEFIAGLDEATCEICGVLDGQHWTMNEYEEGINAPPMHPNCRCTTAAYFSDLFDEGEYRASRNADGKTVFEVPATMSYNEWKDKFVNNNKFTNADKADEIIITVNEKIIKNDNKSFTSDDESGKINNKDLSKYLGEKIKETDNQSIREWYVANVSDIPNQIDKSKPFEEQVHQAYDLRNKYKHEARVAMSDKDTAEILEKKRPVLTFEQLLNSKIERKKITKDEALEDILKTASKTNKGVNKEFGL